MAAIQPSEIGDDVKEPITAEDFFSPWESIASDWRSSRDKIEEIIGITSSSQALVWRGTPDASYSLFSSLYRRLLAKHGASPTESQMLKAEGEILKAARNSWRFDNLSALEIFAQVQHYGGPTRLLDVTYNPLIALWFAVEQEFQSGQRKPETDGRLFAFALGASRTEPQLDEKWGGYEIPWERDKIDGWTTELPLLWRPPEYNPRISAQNAAFLVGGVPSVKNGGNARYRKGPGDGTTKGTWLISEVRQATSVTLFMNTSDRKPQIRSAPTFTIRIPAKAKAEIRGALRQYFGYSSASIYPDLYGLARYGTREF